nr:EOG090X07RL [Lepidurus arcticus]
MATNPRRGGIPGSLEGKDKQDEFLVFGYACKTFRDDAKAIYIDQGKHLIPWMGDENLKIDRYDARGTLHNLQLYEAPPGGYHRFEGLTVEERRIEELCDEERYAALYNDEIEQEAKREEEIKRLHQELSSDASYKQVAFSYDDDSNKVLHGPEPPPVEEEIVEPETPFIPPAALAIPPDIDLPPNQKLALIIARTAQFIVNQGSQMEVILKFKQAHNPNFGFLSFDHVLHLYYKHVMLAIKEGRYTPPKEGEETPQDQEASEDDDSDGDHYLHPSLAGGVSSQASQISSVLYKLPADSAYLRLAAQLKEKTAAIVTLPPPAPPSPPATTASKPVLVPPPTVEAFIDKMASYVAKNGEGFEKIVKAKGDSRFDFLDPSCPHHAYYLFKLESYGKSDAQSKTSFGVVSFSIKGKGETAKALDKSAFPSEESDEETRTTNKEDETSGIEELIENLMHDTSGKEAEEEEDIAPPGDENRVVMSASPVLTLSPSLSRKTRTEEPITDEPTTDGLEKVILASESPKLEKEAEVVDEKDEDNNNSDIEIVGETKKAGKRVETRSKDRPKRERESSRKEKKNKHHKHSKKSHKRRSRSGSRSRGRSLSRSSSRERRHKRKRSEERIRRERERSQERRRRRREEREREELEERERQRRLKKRRRHRSRSRDRTDSPSRSPKKSRKSRRCSSSVSRSPSVDPELPNKRAAIEAKWDILRKKAEQKKGEARVPSNDFLINSPLPLANSSSKVFPDSSSGSRENSLPPSLQQPVVAKLAEIGNNKVSFVDPSLLLRPEAIFANKPIEAFRDYSCDDEDPIKARVRRTYLDMHTYQTADFVKRKMADWLKFDKFESTILEALGRLNSLVDESDPDVDMPNSIHAFQTAERLRKAHPDLDWLHLTGLIHDLGKVMAFYEPQWAVVGDTFPLGCSFAPSIVYRESSFQANPDLTNPKYNTKFGVYEANCGLENVTMSWGHDEYLYRLLLNQKASLPEEALYIIRYLLT